MPSHSDIVRQMREALALSEPELDTSTGSVVRKMLDAVGEVVAEAYIDQQLLGYTYDIDAKMEGDLDSFVELFGISRLAGKRASGVIVFAREQSADDQFVIIPMGSQIVAREDEEDRPVIFQTLASGVLSLGDTSVSVPVQAVQAGPDSNLPAGALNRMISPIAGISTISNPEPLTGGTSMETDSQLRERWKNTVFRNMAGTRQMYIGLALDQADCYAANVIGASKQRREFLQIDSQSATSTIVDAKFIYPGNVVVGNNINNGDIFARNLDYEWDSTNPPTINVLNPDAIADGSIVEVEFEYAPSMSRNDPQNNITNRVDIWCAGVRAVPASQAVVFRGSPTFSNSPSDPYYTEDYVLTDGSTPTAGNTFVPLAFGPLVTVPSTITVNAVTYGLVTPDNPMDSEAGGIRYAYRIVHNNTEDGWAPNSLFGLEWSQNFQPTSGDNFEIEYFYNAVPQLIQRNIDDWRLVTTDALAHQAIQYNIRVNLVVQYHNSLQAAETNEAIERDLDTFFRGQGIGTTIQPSDVLRAVANVSNVDAVRWQYADDHDGYNPATPNDFNVGLQRIIEGNVVESYVDSTGRPTDVHLGDSDVPVFGDTTIIIRAANTFGAS